MGVLSLVRTKEVKRKRLRWMHSTWMCVRVFCVCVRERERERERDREAIFEGAMQRRNRGAAIGVYKVGPQLKTLS